MSNIKLPIGIQSFKSLIHDGYTYIDKTEYIYKLVYGEGRAFFLSRPRRFGKSLFLSTLRAYWEGEKNLFSGLAIEKLDKDNDWISHPVFFFDFNRDNFSEKGSLERVIDDHLSEWEEKYDVVSTDKEKSLAGRFQQLIVKAYETTGKRVVILVDEYDKPLLENGGTYESTEHDKAVYKGFFSTLKSYDEYIRFSFLTGVTRFSKVSIFSDLNHLSDISLSRDYSAVCGITENEIRDNIDIRVVQMAEDKKITKDDCYAKLKKMYDGYHFYHSCEGVYNPFSLLNALSSMEFRSWWFETGTPTYLTEKLKKENYNIREITSGEVYADESQMTNYTVDNPDPVPLLYQTGYLTIQDYLDFGFEVGAF